MKKLSFFLAGLIVLTASFAFAIVTPVPGPFYAKYVNYEIFSDPETWNSQGAEDNWGVLYIQNFTLGLGSFEGIEPDNSIPATFNHGDNGEEISGMFYGIDIIDWEPETGLLGAIGGHLDLYLNELGDLGPNPSTARRTAVDEYSGVTDGLLLLSLDFVLNGDYTVLSTNAVLDNGIPVGDAFSYYTITGGLWADLFDNEYFSEPVAAMFASNVFNPTGRTGPNDFTVISNDPVRGYVVPEPSSVLLLGFGMLGFSALGRRRKMH